MLFRAALLSVMLMAAAPVAGAEPYGVQLAQFDMRPHTMMPMQERGDRQNILPLREVVDIVRSRFGGDLISARLEQGPHPVYVLRWRMPNDNVRDVRVDAVSGQMR